MRVYHACSHHEGGSRKCKMTIYGASKRFVVRMGELAEECESIISKDAENDVVPVMESEEVSYVPESKFSEWKADFAEKKKIRSQLKKEVGIFFGIKSVKKFIDEPGRYCIDPVWECAEGGARQGRHVHGYDFGVTGAYLTNFDDHIHKQNWDLVESRSFPYLDGRFVACVYLQELLEAKISLILRDVLSEVNGEFDVGGNVPVAFGCVRVNEYAEGEDRYSRRYSRICHIENATSLSGWQPGGESDSGKQ
jgi:hypothetical protein